MKSHISNNMYICTYIIIHFYITHSSLFDFSRLTCCSCSSFSSLSLLKNSCRSWNETCIIKRGDFYKIDVGKLYGWWVSFMRVSMGEIIWVSVGEFYESENGWIFGSVEGWVVFISVKFIGTDSLTAACRYSSRISRSHSLSHCLSLCLSRSLERAISLSHFSLFLYQSSSLSLHLAAWASIILSLVTI